MKNPLSTAQITSLDSKGHKINIHPAEVSGFYRSVKNYLNVVLLIIFLLTPWTTINGQQTLLLDIKNREFYIFGFFLRAHNAPLIFLVLLAVTLGLAYVTSVWGRIWCGWTCPQTVFLDFVFRKIEFWVEGNYLKRIHSQKSEFNFKKLFQKSLKWSLFFLASSIIAHSFLSYFVGSYKYVHIINNGPSQHLWLFVATQLFTIVLLFNFGWFREQFCTIMCPYGRIQGLLLDENSMMVKYHKERNDCVNCNRCVVACPIGIDIRNGLQLECISCSACIDACDDIMTKVNKPTRLIEYRAINEKPVQPFKPRSLIYLSAVSISLVILTLNLLNLSHSEAFITRPKEAPFKAINQEIGTNHFIVHLSNQSLEEKKYEIQFNDTEKIKLLKTNTDIILKPKEFKTLHVFFEFNRLISDSEKNIKFSIQDTNDVQQFKKDFEVQLVRF